MKQNQFYLYKFLNMLIGVRAGAVSRYYSGFIKMMRLLAMQNLAPKHGPVMVTL
jgi:ABC-type microcin C transport system permease subunit YejE